MNKKSLRSKEQFHKAIIALMDRKTITDISVREICEEAGLNHSTFYLHYHNVYDLLQEAEDEVLENVCSAVSAEAAPLIAFLDYLKKNGDMFRVLMVRNTDKAFRERLLTLVRQLIDEVPGGLIHERAEYFYNYIIHGSIGVIEEWINRGCQESSEEMEELLTYFAQKILEDYYKR